MCASILFFFPRIAKLHVLSINTGWHVQGGSYLIHALKLQPNQLEMNKKRVDMCHATMKYHMEVK